LGSLLHWQARWTCGFNRTVQPPPRRRRETQAVGVRAQVMLSFATDPYHPGDNTLTRSALETLIGARLGVCTLTKGGTALSAGRILQSAARAAAPL